MTTTALTPANRADAATSRADATADVLISGGGLVGHTLAIALAAHGVRSIVVDPADPAVTLAQQFDGRASAIASGAWKMMEAIGLAPHLDGHGCPIERIWVSDGLKPGELDFAPADDEGFLGIMFENRRMRIALNDAVNAHALIDNRAPVETTSIDRDEHRATITLADGSVLTAPLLCVCEGRRSSTRDGERMPMAKWSYHHIAMVGAIAHEAPHENVAYEIFYSEGPFALLPLNDLPDGRHRSAFVWSVNEKDVAGYMKLGPRGFVAEMTRRMGGILGAIEEIAPRSTFPLTFQHSAELTGQRMALVGDTAHGIHPIAGQGFNLGLRDVATLVEVIVDGMRTGMDPGDAQLLARYQRWRGLDNLSVAASTDGLTRLFGVPGRAASAVRRLGLGGVQKSGILKKFFMAEARGELGDLPKLLAGNLV